MTHQLIQFFALLLLMLVTGIFWGPWFALHRSIHVFNKEQFIQIVKTMAANLAIPMRILMPSCILLMSLSVWMHPQKDSWGFYSCFTALVLIVVSLLVTVLVEVPIVTKIQQWTAATAPSDWQAIRDRWVKFHVVRTFAAIVSFVGFATSILLLQ